MIGRFKLTIIVDSMREAASIVRPIFQNGGLNRWQFHGPLNRTLKGVCSKLGKSRSLAANRRNHDIRNRGAKRMAEPKTGRS